MTCTDGGDGDRVTSISLPGYGLLGSPNAVWYLPALTALDLSNNTLFGKVELPPPGTAQARLVTLKVKNNLLSGPLPGVPYTGITDCDVSGNDWDCRL